MVPPDRDVQILLQTHKATISSLQEVLSDVKLGSQQDEIFLLRYVLSHPGDVPGAADAVRQTLAWQKEKAFLQDAALPGAPPPPHMDVFTRYVAMSTHASTTQGDLVFIVRAGLANSKAMLSELSPETVIDLMMFLRIKMYREMDAVTRRTGRLTKLITVTDLNHASLSKFHSKFPKVLSAVSKLSEIYFPQLLDTGVMINVPTVMKALMRTMWSFFPKKTQQKMRLCPARTLTDDISKCPFVRARFELDSVPTFLGGKCSCPRGCVAGVANDQQSSNEEAGSDGLSKHTVPSRGSYDVFLPVEAGSCVAYAVQVQAGKVSSGPLSMRAVLRGTGPGGKETVVLEPQEYTPEQGTVRGDLVAREAGTVVFTFSNPSPLWSRKVCYSAAEQARLEAVAGEADEEAASADAMPDVAALKV